MRISDWSSDVCSSDLHRRVADRSRGVVEKYVDVLWTGPAERSAQVSRLIVDRGIIAETIEAQPDLVGAARNADRAASTQLADLAARRPDRARRRSPEHGFAALRLATAGDGGAPRYPVSPL